MKIRMVHVMLGIWFLAACAASYWVLGYSERMSTPLSRLITSAISGYAIMIAVWTGWRAYRRRSKTKNRDD